MGSDIPEHFPIFGIRRVREQDLGRIVDISSPLYAKLRQGSLFKIPKIADRFIHVADDGGGTVYFILLNKDGVAEVEYHNRHGEDAWRTVQELVHLAHGYQQPEPQATIYQHPPLSTEYSEISDM